MSELSFNDLLNLSSQGLPTIAGEPVTSQYLKILQEWALLRLRGDWPTCCGVSVQLCFYEPSEPWGAHFDSFCPKCGLTPTDPDDKYDDDIPPYSLDLPSVLRYWREGRVVYPAVQWRVSG